MHQLSARLPCKRSEDTRGERGSWRLMSCKADGQKSRCSIQDTTNNSFLHICCHDIDMVKWFLGGTEISKKWSD